jgi:hypothetical protein
MICGSTVESESIRQTFEAESCFRIVKPVDFSIAVSNAILGFNQSLQGFCNYREYRMIKKQITGMEITDFTGPEGTIIIGGQKGNERADEILGNGIDLMFLKQKKYQEQCEYRFIWSINTQFYQMHEYIDVECKEAIQFCERV